MPEKRYFFRLSGAFFLGLVALIAAWPVFFLLLPIIIPIAVTTMLLVLAFVVVWAAIYFICFLGVAVYYFFKPMEVSKKKKGYSIEKTEEAGRREKKE
jgi:membrane protein implicated in regulation of membrane protease activity